MRNGLLCLALLLAAGCQVSPEVPSKDEILLLAHKQKEILCTYQSMRDSISSKWDNMNNLLDQHLPPDMPLEEKNNMLAVRNADLIRMFQTYDQLDYSIKMELSKMESEDSSMVTRIHNMNERSLDLEQQRMDLFNQVNQKDPQSANRYAILYDSILNQQCETN